jgi:hypothetical protein
MESLRGLYSALYFVTHGSDFPKFKRGKTIMYEDNPTILNINPEELQIATSTPRQVTQYFGTIYTLT